MKTLAKLSVKVILFLGLSFQIQASTVIDLEWRTKSETNNDFFTIERSIDGQIWETIARIDGSGSTTVEHTYSFTDEFAPDGIVYYMLKQTDYDGTSVNSKMISVNNVPKFPNAKVVVYPNITRSDILVQSSNKVVITGIYSSNASKMSVDIDSNSQTVSVEDLPDGMYYIMYKTVDGHEHTQGFVKE